MSFVSTIFIIIATRFIFHFRYTCTFIDQHIDDKFFMWNVSVSDHCCQHCDGVVYKADSVVETVLHEDKCGTVETSICRILPGHFSLIMFLKMFYFKSSLEHSSAVIESEFNYKQCCNDEEGKDYRYHLFSKYF